MNDEKNPFSVDIGLSAKAEIKAEIPAATTGRMLDALTDIIRPWTESRGLQGDRISLQRAEIALEIAGLTAQKIESEKITIAQRETKEIVPILENGSLEEHGSALIEWWANLLKNQLDARFESHPYFAHLLKNINSREAQFLERNFARIVSQNVKNGFLIDENKILVAIEDSIRDFRTEKDNNSKNIETVYKKLENVCREQNGILVNFTMPMRVDGILHHEVFKNRTFANQDDFVVAQILCGLRILRILNFSLHSQDLRQIGAKIEVELLTITDLGFDFLRRVLPEIN